MKLQPDPKQSLNTVTRYDAEYIEINEQRFENSIIVMPEGEVLPWNVNYFAQLEQPDFHLILEKKPALVIFGSGKRLRFLHPTILQDLIQAKIGFETMDTQAACRTYNILMSEGRLVLGAFLIEK
ncbi:hypothetical protein PSHI8_08510 [Polynucleobacter sp. SHI8]|uniref:Mth938-like domain-containing protein n=1 Tax=unclassified Polynucleobacter TaxID=2640945 RepID=UPI00249358CF|nr:MULTISPECIES: Mth938-like domain-containing protein [unclassified Polynucleobacter]BDW10769.1 hypothetical protein PSHI2_08510 [Polynucleobacter sp. SHI2]BDW13215.1 hypothetical protein PSHI8_08510 [Polynucleobacter sp. SHI8]